MHTACPPAARRQRPPLPARLPAARPLAHQTPPVLPTDLPACCPTLDARRPPPAACADGMRLRRSDVFLYLGHDHAAVEHAPQGREGRDISNDAQQQGEDDHRGLNVFSKGRRQQLHHGSEWGGVGAAQRHDEDHDRAQASN